MQILRANIHQHLRAGLLAFIAVILLLPVGCTAPESTAALVPVIFQLDGQQVNLDVPAGTTVQFAIEKAQITLNNLDRVDPPTYSLLTAPATIKITRVREEFENQESVIPFERQTVRNESLPEGQTLLIQPGANGIQQVTYRRVLEDNVEVSKTIFKTLVLTEARPEIVMVGVQTPFSALPLPGTLAYLTAGNAWVMEKTTGERRPVVTSGDLDGRVFALSPDRQWLLFTRKADPDSPGQINSLYVVHIADSEAKPVSLKVNNVIHFAAWVPGAGSVVMVSTVEPRDTAPGWQANNDLRKIILTGSGTVAKDEVIIAPNSGGIYGWWGTTYAFSPDGSELAYARPDSIGLVNFEEGKLQPFVDLIPLQTRSDWAWVPGIGWAPDSDLLYTVSHVALSGLTTDEISPLFDVIVVDPENNQAIDLIPQAGMFAYPVPSPQNIGDRLKVAYLQAIFPEQSETSRYRLVLMDRDGSNRTAVFPPEGSPGMDPQQIVWGPMEEGNPEASIALMYQGNLWLYNVSTGQAQQITGDGSIGRVDWK